MARIAVLGLGAMGRRMAQRLVLAGHDLRVWSRSGLPGEAEALRGCACSTPGEAVEGVDVAIAVVTDDEASRQVWQRGALAGLKSGALAIESSTISPAWARELAAQARAVGARFLDAPVVGSRPQAEAGTLAFLVGGEPDDVARARPVLLAMGSAIHALGATPRGAVAKLAVNALFAAQVALVAELLGAARASGLETPALLEVLGSLPVLSPAAKAAGSAIVAGRFEPQFPIALVAKDLRYAVAAAEAGSAPLPLTQRLRELFERAEASGLGAENITAIAKLYHA